LAEGRRSIAELAAEILPASPKENPHE
jgi:hypothetical protein